MLGSIKSCCVLCKRLCINTINVTLYTYEEQKSCFVLSSVDVLIFYCIIYILSLTSFQHIIVSYTICLSVCMFTLIPSYVNIFVNVYTSGASDTHSTYCLFNMIAMVF